jgi:hypothetical protein
VWIRNGFNYSLPEKMPLSELEEIGDKFLADKSGWFDKRSFDHFVPAPKDQSLLGDVSKPKGA